MTENEFDPVIFPLGKLAQITTTIPHMELTLEATGFTVRESLDLSFKYIYPIINFPLQAQWAALWENCLDYDVMNLPLDGIMTLARDPLLMLHYLLQRAPDKELPVRCCLITKYPV